MMSPQPSPRGKHRAARTIFLLPPPCATGLADGHFRARQAERPTDERTGDRKMSYSQDPEARATFRDAMTGLAIGIVWVLIVAAVSYQMV